jgi:hypothetical protein
MTLLTFAPMKQGSGVFKPSAGWHGIFGYSAGFHWQRWLLRETIPAGLKLDIGFKSS